MNMVSAPFAKTWKKPSVQILLLFAEIFFFEINTSYVRQCFDGTFDKQMDYHFAHLLKLVPWRYSMEWNPVVNGKKGRKKTEHLFLDRTQPLLFIYNWMKC